MCTPACRCIFLLILRPLPALTPPPLWYLDVYGRGQSLCDLISHGEVAAGYRPVHNVVGVHHGNQPQRHAHLLHYEPS